MLYLISCYILYSNTIVGILYIMVTLYIVVIHIYQHHNVQYHAGSAGGVPSFMAPSPKPKRCPGSHEGFGHVGVAGLHQLVHWSGKLGTGGKGPNPTGKLEIYTLNTIERCRSWSNESRDSLSK